MQIRLGDRRDQEQYYLVWSEDEYFVMLNISNLIKIVSNGLMGISGSEYACMATLSRYIGEC